MEVDQTILAERRARFPEQTGSAVTVQFAVPSRWKYEVEALCGEESTPL